MIKTIIFAEGLLLVLRISEVSDFYFSRFGYVQFSHPHVALTHRDGCFFRNVSVDSLTISLHKFFA